jgi:serine protease DegQ
VAEGTDNTFAGFAEAMADAVEKAGASTVLVNARNRLPATGIAWAIDLVATADHAIEREDEITVAAADGKELPATLVGRDPASDIAVLRVQGTLTPAAIRAEALRPGHLVFAVGRPGTGGVQASLGIVSALGGPWRTRSGRRVGGSIRTDTTFFPGFSGGPLVDAAGQVAGMNTSRFGRGSPITLPAEVVSEVVAALVAHGHIRRGYLGIGSQPTQIAESLQAKLSPPQETGLLIVGVEADSPAAKGGMLVGDILVGIDESPVRDTRDLQIQLDGEIVGKPIKIRVLRGGEPADLTVKVGERG